MMTPVSSHMHTQDAHSERYADACSVAVVVSVAYIEAECDARYYSVFMWISTFACYYLWAFVGGER